MGCTADSVGLGSSARWFKGGALRPSLLPLVPCTPSSWLVPRLYSRCRCLTADNAKADDAKADGSPSPAPEAEAPAAGKDKGDVKAQEPPKPVQYRKKVVKVPLNLTEQWDRSGMSASQLAVSEVWVGGGSFVFSVCGGCVGCGGKVPAGGAGSTV